MSKPWVRPQRLSAWAALSLAVAFTLAALGVSAAEPYGLDARAPIGAYLNGQMPSSPGTFPALLSQTGAFANVTNLTPATGVIPYTVNSPLWSDAALKVRWIAVPNDGAPYTAGEQISFAPTGEWTFPNGTVFVKHFDLVVNEGTGARKRLETRLLVRDNSDKVYGVTYNWLANHTDAQLVADSGATENFTITNSSGGTRVQTWAYPSRSDCLRCHNQPSGFVLGVKTRQLNGDFTYPATGRTDNQLRTLNHVGLCNPPLDEAAISNYTRMVAVSATNAPIEHRTRSWLDSNCSQCHRPGGEKDSWDARYDTPLASQNLLNNFVLFRNVSASQLHQRGNSLQDGFMMPPLAKRLVDTEAMQVLAQWINSPLSFVSAAGEPSRVTLTFDRAIDPATGGASTNYQLNSGTTILSAAVSGSSVVLNVNSMPVSASRTVTVNNVRDTAGSANTIWPNTQRSFTVQPANTPPTVALSSPTNGDSFRAPTDLTLTATATDSDGTVTNVQFYNATNLLGQDTTSPYSFTWSNVVAGNYALTARAVDNGGRASTSAVVTITVTNAPPPNTPPTLSLLADQSVDEESTLSFTATATDADVPAQPLTFSLGAGAPSGVAITSDGNFTWTPTEAQGPGTNTVKIVVTDNGTPALSATQTVSIIVNEVNVAPTLTVLAPQFIHEGEAVSLSLIASDTDVPFNTLAFSLSNAPAGASVTTAGLLTWTPAPSQLGLHNFSARVTDNGTPQLSDTRPVLVEVHARPFITSLAWSNQIVTIHWSAIADKVYRLQYKTNLTEAAWTTLAGDVTAAGSTAQKVDPVGSDSQRFYRVEVVP